MLLYIKLRSLYRSYGEAGMSGSYHSFYFAGDMCYCNAFEQKGRTYEPFPLAAFNIGS